MPKILITGNGFDLNIGLPTSYNDFIKILTYIESNDDWSFKKIYSCSENYCQIEKNFNTFKVDNKMMLKLKNGLEHNLWFQFFKTEYQIETWIDFENKIEYVLEKIFSSIKILEKKIFKGNGITPDSLFYSTDLFDSKIEIVEVLKRFKIIVMEENNYHLKLNINFLINKYNYYLNIDVNALTKYLYQQLVDFKLIFNYYFETLINPLYDEIKLTIDSEYFKNIDYHYTFNYTSTFDNLYTKNITRHLHGKINSEENQIVLGINEIPQNENYYKKEFIPFTKYFQKLNNDTDYAFIRELSDDEYEDFIFVFWGHSLDKSDQDYINEVFDLVSNLKSYIRKIVIVYHEKKSKSKMLINLLDIRGKKNIQDLMRSNILVFEHIESTELKFQLMEDLNM